MGPECTRKYRPQSYTRSLLPSTVEAQSASPGEYHHLGLWVRIPVPLEGVWLKVPTLQNSSHLHTHTHTTHTHTPRQSAKPVQNEWVPSRGHPLLPFKQQVTRCGVQLLVSTAD
jgi:hypothetical protein